MGESVVMDRFGQIEPKILLAVDSYSYNGRVHDRAAVVAALIDKLPSVASIIHVPGPLSGERPVHWAPAIPWPADDAAASLTFERVPFSHPLWIVYSSGTTGLPKAMVHGHGGIVLTQLKTLALQHDLRPGDRMLFLGSTGWIVWNHLVGGLLTGATILLYDGSPSWPDSQALWRFIDRRGVTLFGCGATFLVNCMKAGLRPRGFVALDRLRAINSTGSPLSEDGFRWVYDAVKPNLWLASVSGGTDIASGFVACSPTLPVYAGEIQCRELGVAAYAFDEAGQPITDKMGELVVTKPMPSMPVRFWNDHGNRRYLESYFEMFPGVWRQGDWIRITSRGTCVIYGRSDTTINRHGIRIGTAEIYRVVEELPEILDSLVVDLEFLGRDSFMPLFVVLAPGFDLDDPLKTQITDHIRRRGSARHVPSAIYRIDEVPRTLTGKKMELPVRKLLLGSPADKVASADAMLNPGSLAYFIDLAASLTAARTAQDRAAEPLPKLRLAASVLTQTHDAGSRSSLARTEAADAVQTNGFGSVLCSARYRLMAACKSTREWKVPRRMRFRVSTEKKFSTAFSQEPEVGVKWNVQRGWRSSQALTFGCLCVA